MPVLSNREAARLPLCARVVILGGGFAGLNAARRLGGASVDVILVDRRNYHLFQPLLYQVATAALAPSQIAAPIRQILRRQANAEVIMADVTKIDLGRRYVQTSGPALTYDYLIIATGAQTSYLGNPHWETVAPGLKTVEEATYIRSLILTAFEEAEASGSAPLTFVVIGGGPTGVEIAGAIAELTHRSIVNDFRRIDTRETRCVLIEAGPRLLPAMPPELSVSAARQLEAAGVDVIVGKSVTKITRTTVTLGDGAEIQSACTIWAAGVKASPVADWLGVEPVRGGRVAVCPDLTLPGHPEVFVTGDAAMVLNNGIPVPGVAPAAKQMGIHAARTILADIHGKPRRAFRFRDQGALATIGRKAAVADFGRIRLHGLAAWLVWSGVHLWFLVGFRNRVMVFLDWFWAYITHHRGVRLITRDRGDR